jgi:hypothetical protein
MKSKRTIIIVGVIFLCVICGMIGSLTDKDEPEETSTALAPSTATATEAIAVQPTTAELSATPIPPTPTLKPSATSIPPTPTPEIPQCQGKIQTYDFDTRPLEIVQEIIQDVACLDFFSLSEPKPGVFNASTDLIISPNVSKEIVLQIVFDINKELFTSNTGIGRVDVMVHVPDDPIVPGVNQSLGTELAEQFNDQWETATPQEWWDWLDENQTPVDDITGDCEQFHNARWDKRPEYAPWK